MIRLSSIVLLLLATTVLSACAHIHKATEGNVAAPQTTDKKSSTVAGKDLIVSIGADEVSVGDQIKVLITEYNGMSIERRGQMVPVSVEREIGRAEILRMIDKDHAVIKLLGDLKFDPSYRFETL